MNHPFCDCQHWLFHNQKGNTHEEEEGYIVEKFTSTTRCHNSVLDRKAAGSQENSEGDPETTIG